MDKASAAKRRKLAGLAAAFLPLATLGLPGNADAKIIKIVIAKKAPAFEGATFGAVGAYEQLDGTAYGEIDPRDPLNAVITDIALAPRNARGMVEYSMGISILKPVDMSKGNRTLLYEVVNRGRKNLPALNIGGDGAKAGRRLPGARGLYAGLERLGGRHHGRASRSRCRSRPIPTDRRSPARCARNISSRPPARR